jgi:TldD protein
VPAPGPEALTEFDVASAAVEAALAAGAQYADARVMHRRYESMSARNGDVEDVEQSEDSGIGIRARVGTAWGFFAVPDLADAPAREAGARAATIAAASGFVQAGAGSHAGNEQADLVPARPVVASWRSPCQLDPLGVPLSVKGDLVAGATAQAHRAGADVAEGTYRIWDTRKWFVSSEGHRIDQHIRECGAGIWATAVGDGQTQRRSYPCFGGHYGTRGWELVTELDLPAQADRIADEARALLTAPPCPAGQTSLILGGQQMAMQIHESVGHAIELDRILGWEAAFAGTSWLDLARLGNLTYGSELMNIVIDPTIPGALGSFGYDDEGTPAAPRYAVQNGQWVGVLAGRDSSARAGLDYAGSVRADGWARLPMVRMTNVGLLPGPHTLDEMIEATQAGIYMDTNRSWSIDDKRLNFQFGCEIGWEIKDGKLGRMVRNPTYTGIGPRFWGSLDMLSAQVESWGTANCGKGQPLQIGHTGHPAAPARFHSVRVGVRG